jgi:hypothetical protein
MIERRKLKYEMTNDRASRVRAYCVDSERDKITHYFADTEKMAIVRHDDLIAWDLSETPAAAQIFVGPIKREILEIYEDIKDLALMEAIFYEAGDQNKDKASQEIPC